MSHQDRSYLKTQIETTESDIRGADSDTLKTLDDKIDVIDGYHDVATVDGTADTVMRDVVGRKTDAAVTTVGTVASVLAYIKGLLNQVAKVPLSDGSVTWNATALASLQTEATDALNAYDPPTRTELTTDIAVPAADATANVDVSDVVGNKSDAAVTTVGIVASVLAYIKGVLNNLAAVKTKTDYLPSATAGAAGGVFIAGSNAATTVAITGNITGNLSGSVGSVTGAVGSVTGNVSGSVASVTGAVGSVTGNVSGTIAQLVDGGFTDLLIDAIKAKTDTIAASPVSTASATTTGVIVEDGTTGAATTKALVSSATANTFGAWVQIDESLSADSWLCGMVLNPQTTSGSVVEIGTGAGGAEVTIIRYSLSYVGITESIIPITFPIPKKVVSGTRIAARCADRIAVANTLYCSVQYYQSLET